MQAKFHEIIPEADKSCSSVSGHLDIKNSFTTIDYA